MTPSPQHVAWLQDFGPWLVGALAFLETSFITGLMIPSGPVLITASALAAEGVLSLEAVILAAFVGGALGDGAGFWIGRRGGRRVLEAGGRLGRIARRVEPRTRALFERAPWMGITGARLISFVRTLMPAIAGAGGTPFSRFLLWDLPGVAGWTALYVGIGLAIDGGWRILAEIVGTIGALIVLGLLIGAGAVLVRRHRRRAEIEAHSPGVVSTSRTDAVRDDRTNRRGE